MYSAGMVTIYTELNYIIDKEAKTSLLPFVAYQLA